MTKGQKPVISVKGHTRQGKNGSFEVREHEKTNPHYISQNLQPTAQSLLKPTMPRFNAEKDFLEELLKDSVTSGSEAYMGLNAHALEYACLGAAENEDSLAQLVSKFPNEITQITNPKALHYIAASKKVDEYPEISEKILIDTKLNSKLYRSTRDELLSKRKLSYTTINNLIKNNRENKTLQESFDEIALAKNPHLQEEDYRRLAKKSSHSVNMSLLLNKNVPYSINETILADRRDAYFLPPELHTKTFTEAELEEMRTKDKGDRSQKDSFKKWSKKLEATNFTLQSGEDILKQAAEQENCKNFMHLFIMNESRMKNIPTKTLRFILN